MSTPSVLSASDEFKSREALAQMLWTGGIIGFFSIQAIIWVVAITLTHNDPSHAVIASLDERSSSSDERRAVREASERLGWKTSVAIESPQEPSAKRRVQIRILDPMGQPVAVEKLEVFGFHRARVTERKALTLEAVEPGVWQVNDTMTRAGWWRFEGQASLGSDRYQFELTEFLQL
jgi:nitrogen fixation protein FixH